MISFIGRHSFSDYLCSMKCGLSTSNSCSMLNAITVLASHDPFVNRFFHGDSRCFVNSAKALPLARFSATICSYVFPEFITCMKPSLSAVIVSGFKNASMCLTSEGQLCVQLASAIASNQSTAHPLSRQMRCDISSGNPSCSHSFQIPPTRSAPSGAQPVA